MWWAIGTIAILGFIALAIYSVLKLRKEDAYDDALK